MEQTKAVILHRAETVVVPGAGAIPTVHMLQAWSLYYFTVTFLKSRKSSQLIFWET